jgi:MoxR-like ATPase
VHGLASRVRAVEKAAGKVLAGGTDFARDVLSAVLAQGHVVLAGVPAAAQPAVLRTIAEVIGLNFAQVDAASGADWMSDNAIVGSQILLVNRLDRAAFDTQTLLFQTMANLRMEKDGQKRPIEPPFVVIASQPTVNNGVPMLSESLMDYFMFFIEWSALPDGSRVVVDLTASPGRAAEKMLTTRQLLELQRVIREMVVSDHVVKYAVRIVRATRPTDKRAPETIKKHVHSGAGPLAVQHLIQAAKARAVLDGRLLVDIADVRNSAMLTLCHRLCASFTAGADGWSPRSILQKLIAEVDARDE